MRTTPDNHVQDTTLNGNNEISGNLESATTVAATANQVYDRDFSNNSVQTELFAESKHKNVESEELNQQPSQVKSREICITLNFKME